MNTRRWFNRFTLSTVIVLGALTAGRATDTTPPAIINTLTAQSDNSGGSGSVLLNWTAVGNDGVGNGPATNYVIKYRPFDGTNFFVSETDWSNAQSIDVPPVNIVPPAPLTSGSSETFGITRLSPGVSYVFSIRALDAALNVSPLFSGATAQASLGCSQQPNDGQGLAVFLPVTNIPAGQVSMTTMTYTVAASGISQGGKLILRVPDSWAPPFIPSGAGAQMGNISGEVRLTTTTATATLMAITTGQMVVVNVVSGFLASGDVVNIHYGAFTCEPVGNSRSFYVLSQAAACGVPTIVNSFTRTVSVGAANRIEFRDFNLSAQIDTITTIGLVARDQCGNFATLASPVSLDLTAILSYSPFTIDSVPVISTSADFSAPFAVQTIVMQSGVQQQNIYYRLSSVDFTPMRYLNMQYTFPGQMYPNTYSLNIQNFQSGITGTSVDTGQIISTQKTVTFTPDGNGVDDSVFINFSLPVYSSWEVDLSTDSFSTLVRRFFGYGQTARISWDGFTDWAPNVQPRIADPTTYAVRIALPGNSLVDTSLSVTLSAAGVSGYVQDDSSNPLGNVDINIFGPAGRFLRSNSDGTFNAYGLQAGNYTVRFSKTGYEFKEIPVAVTSGLLAISTVTLARQSILIITSTRPASASLPEVWGNYNANTSDWKKTAYGNVHFGIGSLTADAGDNWNAMLTTYTALSLTPGLDYNVHLNIPNYSATDFHVTLGQGEVRNVTVGLLKRANISGVVQVPSNPTGLWISVEAGPDANNDGVYDNQDYTKRYYGGVYLNAGSTSGIFNIFGVADNTYALRTQAPGYVRASTSAVVSGGVDVTNVVFPPLSQGGSITGTLTFTGDLSGIPVDGNGNFMVPVNCWSPSTFEGTSASVLVNSSSLAPTSFTLSGLSDGTYQVYVYLNGFETSPPGQKTITVIGGSGTLDLTMHQFAGSLSGQITLPNGNVDYSNVQFELTSYGYGVTPPQVTIDGTGHYSFDHLGTNFYSLKAFYKTTGFYFQRNIQITNGIPYSQDISLVGTTQSISGRVSTNASSPYNSLTYLVNQTTPTTLFIMSMGSSPVIPANRIVAKRFDPNNQNSFNGNSGVLNAYDPSTTFFGFYDATLGTYTISNLSPGTYQLFLNNELDGDFSDGNEVAKQSRLVNIIAADLANEDFTMTDGFTVSGTLVVDSGDVESGRPLDLALIDSQGDGVQKASVYLSGTSATFSLSRVPAGSYVLQVNDNQMPKKYSAKQLNVTVVSADITNQEIRLFQAAKIQGQLRLKKSSQLLTSVNYSQTLSDSFYIEARSNPWFPGGFGRSETPIIGSDGYFTLNVNPGTYDVLLRSDGFIGDSDIARGKKQFVNQRIGGISVEAGQVKNLGVIDLVEGQSLSGTVTDLNGLPLPNIRVEVMASGSHRDGENSLDVFTDKKGSYTVVGIDPDTQRYYDVIAAPRPRADDSRFAGFTGPRYGEVRKSQVDTQASTSVNFKLQLAKGVIVGHAVTSDSGKLINPFSDRNLPGADIILNRRGVIPTDNPVGEIEENVAADGSFNIQGLLPGVYDATVLAQGYSSGISKGIVVNDDTVDVGTVTLNTGFKLTGTILKGDGSAVSENEYSTLVGIRNGFEEILVGTLFTDASDNIISYSLSGFQANKAYNILLFGDDNNSVVMASNIMLANDSTLNLTLRNQTPSIFSRSEKSGSDRQIQFNFTKPLRNSSIDLDANGLADDSEGNKIITLKSGAGTLTIPTNWLSGDRMRADVTYTPAVGETSFVLTVIATFTSVNPDTGLNDYITQDFTYYVGIGKQKSLLLNNAGGGEVLLDNDPSKFVTQPGTFGDDASLGVNVIFRSADQSSDLTSVSANSLHASRAQRKAQQLGVNAYPPEMSKAFIKAQATDTKTFSSFYDVFLPQGVSHFFPTGKEAQICLKYDSTDPELTDPASLNIYYYNPTTNEYLLESQNKTVDTDNERICASIGHASVFTTLASSQSIISGAGYTGELAVMNFPNPFDLNTKTLTLQDPGSAAASQSIEGTMIKMSIPVGTAGAVEIKIYNVVGELVRTLTTNIATGGSHFYLEWDGRNDHGQKVASGTYVARFTIGGGSEKIFKMAVLK